MAVVYGILAAVCFGTNDWSAMRAGRIATSRQVVATGVGAAGVMLAVVAPFWHGRWDGRSVVIGMASGVGVCIGLSLLMYAFSIAPMGTSTPVNAVVSTSIPVLWDAVRGRGLTGLALVGMFVGLAAVGLTSYSPGGDNRHRWRGLTVGAASGVSFGAAFTLMSSASSESGIWPVASQRLAASATLIIVALCRRERVFAPSSPGRWNARRTATWSGMVAGLGVVSLITGYRTGQLAPTAVASSQGAAVGVLLAAMFDHQKLRWWQLVGLVAAGVGVSLLAIG